MIQKNFCRSFYSQVAISLCLVLSGMLLHHCGFAQQGDTLRQPQQGEIIRKIKQADSVRKAHPGDTAGLDYMTRIKKFGEEEANKNYNKFKEGRTAVRQNELIENIVRTTLKSKDYLRRGIDTLGISAELDKINSWYDVVSDGVFINQGSVQTHRNLAVSSQLLTELIYKTEAEKLKLDNYYNDLVNFSNKLDSLSSDSAIYSIPSDSAQATSYLEKVAIAASAVKPVDSSLKEGIVAIQALLRQVNLLENMLNYRQEEVEEFRQALSDKIIQREVPNLGDTIKYTRSLRSIINFSKDKAMLTLWFYYSNNLGTIMLLLVLIICAYLFLRSLKQKVSDQGLLKPGLTGQLVFRYPLLSAIFVVLNLFQFVFLAPPFVFNVWFWIISAGCLTVICWNYISSNSMLFWFIILFLFLLACLDNIILQASRAERWAMLFLAGAGVITGSLFLLKANKRQVKEKGILYFIGFVVLLEFASIIPNIYGRYNFSKTLFVTGYLSLIIAILFLWCVRLINEVLSHASEVYIRPEKRLFYVNFEQVGKKAPSLFYVLLIIGWFVLVGRNFYLYKLITEPFEELLFSERTIGKYTFTVSSILVFILILALSALASKIVSYFSAVSAPDTGDTGKMVKTGLGSWLLLVRIAIVSIGVFLAFAAAGIPMDRLTIILGALSVGIGFGLQALINNLVSGLIIAFEKPVNVGDIIEIAGKSGTMKSIGFRSSVIITWEGSNVIIPNGDLLSQHLINWTMNDTMRRVEILVGVSYETNLERAEEILNQLLASNEKVLKTPAPLILFNEFSESSIDVRILFWVEHYSEWIEVKSGVIKEMDVLFRKHEIKIPFPQRDLHVHNVNPDESQEQKADEPEEQKEEPGEQIDILNPPL